MKMLKIVVEILVCVKKKTNVFFLCVGVRSPMDQSAVQWSMKWIKVYILCRFGPVRLFPSMCKPMPDIRFCLLHFSAANGFGRF